jgi:hypothetical protein
VWQAFSANVAAKPRCATCHIYSDTNDLDILGPMSDFASAPMAWKLALVASSAAVSETLQPSGVGTPGISSPALVVLQYEWSSVALSSGSLKSVVLSIPVPLDSGGLCLHGHVVRNDRTKIGQHGFNHVATVHG